MPKVIQEYPLRYLAHYAHAMNTSFFTTNLILWYNKNKRELPFRKTRNPYYIWLAEIIFQQTRIQQGLPYYEKFVTQFPTVHELAAADEQTVLRLWQGLGYYSRARNLHATAKIITEKYQGTFPSTYQELKKLKGVGDYTAAAIASFAFDEVQAVLDGNVFRVLSRFFGVEKDIASTAGKKYFRKLAQELIPNDSPAVYNQAIMEFGALQCTPQKPNCTGCPLQNRCVAFAKKLQDQLPIKERKIKVKNRFFHYISFEKQNERLMKKRPNGDIWQGLYDFFVIETMTSFLKESEVERQLLYAIDTKTTFSIAHESMIFKHQLSHQTLWAKFYRVEIKDDKLWNYLQKRLQLESYLSSELETIPKPVLISNYLSYLETHLL